mgnify:CR=1 FL=1
MLRKHQEENQLPYEIGAWEAFEKKRAAIAPKKTVNWISGIAASLALLLMAGGIWLSQELETENLNSTNQIALEEQTSGSETGKSEIIPNESAKTLDSNESGVVIADVPQGNLSQKIKVEGKRTAEKAIVTYEANASANQSTTASKPDISDLPLILKPSESLQSLESPKIPEVIVLPKATESLTKPELRQGLIASKEIEGDRKGIEKSTFLEEKVVIKTEQPKEPQLTEKELEEILETPTYTNLALGLSPGFGASQANARATSGSSIGVGLMVDRNITGKLILGSGVAVNYLNQASESQRYLQVAGFSSPVTEKNEIAQVQVDIPLYFKYPITRNQSISIQAGFSNLVTFNQAAETEFNYTRQVSVFNANAASPSNSFTLRSESVDQFQALDVPQNRFYPFATANLGVNFRLYESKKTSYEVMPFYNYPLQEFSGYGEKLGMFGASFKVNFGNVKR